MWLGSFFGQRPTIRTTCANRLCTAARSSEQRAPLGCALRLGHQNSVRDLIEHVPGHVLKHVLVRHVPEHVLGHMLEHVMRHVPVMQQTLYDLFII